MTKLNYCQSVACLLLIGPTALAQLQAPVAGIFADPHSATLRIVARTPGAALSSSPGEWSAAIRHAVVSAKNDFVVDPNAEGTIALYRLSHPIHPLAIDTPAPSRIAVSRSGAFAAFLANDPAHLQVW